MKNSQILFRFALFLSFFPSSYASSSLDNLGQINGMPQSLEMRLLQKNPALAINHNHAFYDHNSDDAEKKYEEKQSFFSTLKSTLQDSILVKWPKNIWWGLSQGTLFLKTIFFAGPPIALFCITLDIFDRMNRLGCYNGLNEGFSLWLNVLNTGAIYANKPFNYLATSSIGQEVCKPSQGFWGIAGFWDKITASSFSPSVRCASNNMLIVLPLTAWAIAHLKGFRLNKDLFGKMICKKKPLLDAQQSMGSPKVSSDHHPDLAQFHAQEKSPAPTFLGKIKNNLTRMKDKVMPQKSAVLQDHDIPCAKKTLCIHAPD